MFTSINLNQNYSIVQLFIEGPSELIRDTSPEIETLSPSFKKSPSNSSSFPQDTANTALPNVTLTRPPSVFHTGTFVIFTFLPSYFL